MEGLAPSLKLKLKNDPNQIIRNVDSRQRYEEKVKAQLDEAFEDQEKLVQKQPEVLTMLDGLLGPRDWSAEREREKNGPPKPDYSTNYEEFQRKLQKQKQKFKLYKK